MVAPKTRWNAIIPSPLGGLILFLFRALCRTHTLHPLHQRLRKIAGRAKRLTLGHAACWFGVAAVLACSAVGLLDYMIRSDEPPIRLFASGALVAALVWAYRRFLRPAAASRLTDLQVASRIERRFPTLEGHLSNTVAFLSQDADDPLAGSYAMRRAVVSKTMASLENINLNECLDASPVRKAVAAAFVATISFGGIYLASPPAVTHAATRLLLPLGDLPWPRRNSLDFVDPPATLAKGGDFEVEIVDRNGRMPESVALTIWREGEKPQTRDAVFVGGRMLARVNNLSKGFRYRAVGGDDDSMAWRNLEVVEPPLMLSFSATVTPPQYSGWPEQSFDHDLRGLTGSRLTIAGAVDQLLLEAVLVVQSMGAAPTVIRTPLKIDGKRFSSRDAGVLSDSGDYWVELTDQRRVQFGKPAKWRVEVIPDNPPSVAFGGQSVPRFATRAAVVPLHAIARDDLALRDAKLVFRRSSDSEAAAEIVDLWSRADPPARESAQPVDERITLEHPWRIDAVPGLLPGDVLEFQITALDFAGQSGESPPQRLTIVSRSELEDRLARNQAYILERIAEALRVQQESRKQITSLEIQWAETKAFRKTDGDQLQSAELNQRQVTRLLAGPQEGAMGLIDVLTRNIVNNRLNNPEFQRRVKQLSDGVGAVVKQLPDVQRPLLSALKDVRPALLRIQGDDSAPISAETAKSMQLAGDKQDQVINALERLLGEMTQWENYRRFAREVGRIQREQADVESQTDQTRLETLAHDLDSLTPEQRAKLLRLAQHQLELAQRLDKLQSRMGQASEALQEKDPLTAETLADAAAASQRMATSGQMRESARRLRANQVGQAKQRQLEVNDGLSELLNILGNRREDELDRKLRKLKEVDAALADLQRQENAIAGQLDDAAKQDDQRNLQQLSKQQQALSQQADQTAKRLKRLEADDSAAAANEAAQAMQASGQAGEQANQNEAAEQAKSALEKLQQARKELAQQVRQAEQDLFLERLARLEQKIRGLAMRQESIRETLRELILADGEGQLTREQLATLDRLAEHQSDLGVETGEMGDKVADAAVFALALEAASREMSRAGDFLNSRQLADADLAETVALTRLQQILDALKPGKPPQGDPQQKPPGGQDGKPKPPADGIDQLAQLKLVKLLQEEIHRRTMELEKLSVSRPLSPSQLSEYEDLSLEQGRLADIVGDLIQAAEQAASDENLLDDPDQLGRELLEDLESGLEQDKLRE